MKKILLSSVIMSAIAAAGSASAADLAPAYSPPLPAPFTWTGFYVGVEGGGGAQYDSITGKYGVGGIVGGEIGYNYQINAFVVGIEGEGLWSNLKSRSDTSTQIPGFFTSSLASLTTNSLFDVAVRVGFTTFDRALVYGKLGAIWADQRYSATTNTPVTYTTGRWTSPGVLLGVGFEYAITNNWIARIETDAQWFNGTDATFTGSGAFFIPTTTKTINTISNVAKIGVSYKF
jgi:outer membrane immunogenic protein